MNATTSDPKESAEERLALAPLLAPALALCGGVLLGDRFPIPARVGGWACGGLLAAGGWAWKARTASLARVALLATCTALGWTRGSDLGRGGRGAAPTMRELPPVYGARLAAAPERRQGRDRVRLEVLGNGGGAVLLSAPPGSLSSLLPGRRVVVRGRSRRPRNFGNPGEFDSVRWLARQGILWTGSVSDGRWVAPVAERSAPLRARLRGGIERLRRRMRSVFDSLADVESRAVLRALTLGEAGTIPMKLREDFARSGTAHVYSVSGLHFAIVAGLLYLPFRRLFGRLSGAALRWTAQRLAATCVLPFLAAYVLVAGAAPPTLRSFVMVTGATVGLLLGRRSGVVQGLALALLVLVSADPASLFDLSFQLSFLSLGAILLLVPPPPGERSAGTGSDGQRAAAWRRAAGRGASWAAWGAMTTLAAVLGTAPMVARVFNQLPVWSVPANWVVVPLLGTLATPCGLLSGAVGLALPGLARHAVGLCGIVARGGIAAVHGFASLPGAGLRVPTPDPWEMGGVAGALLLWGLRRSWRRWAVVLLGLTAVHSVQVERASRNLRGPRVTFLSVGQGDAALIELPGPYRVLIDGGGGGPPRGGPSGEGAGGFDPGERIVAPFLWRQRILRLDAVVLSHPHQDHVGGLPFILREFGVRQVWMSAGTGSPAPGFSAFREAIQAGEIPMRELRRGDRLALGPSRWEVLGPVPGGGGTLNDRSLVLRMEAGGFSVLFPGDLEDAASEILRDMRPVSVVKVPHHGLVHAGSTVIVGAARPRVAVVSVGWGNRFGAPSDPVIDRYMRSGIRVYRTDQDGAVRVEPEGRGLRVRTFGAWSRPEGDLVFGPVASPTGAKDRDVW